MPMEQSQSPFPAIEAHRGDSSNAPENTLAAFKAAIDLRAPWIELDVHPTRDGALVVIHDDTVERTTGAAGAVCDLGLAEIQKLDAGSWFSPRFAGERIPQLAEVFELVAPSATRLNIEIKAAPKGLSVTRAWSTCCAATGRSESMWSLLSICRRCWRCKRWLPRFPWRSWDGGLTCW